MDGHSSSSGFNCFLGQGWNRRPWSYVSRLRLLVLLPACIGLIGLGLIQCPGIARGEEANEQGKPYRHIREVIPILGTTFNERSQHVGIVAEIVLEFTRRRDHDGLSVLFDETPGKFSPFAQQSVIQAIQRVTRAAELNPDSWTIRFTLPYPGVTLYGESLSAMAALNVVALAKNEPVYQDTVLTGTVMPDGSLGVVGGVPLKISAAYEKHFRTVVIPDELDVADGDWETPFLMEVTPVRTINKAYFVLTHHPLRTRASSQPIVMPLSR